MGYRVSMAKIPCPIPGYDETGGDGQPRYYVTVPDEWLGLHSEVYSHAVNSIVESGLIKRGKYGDLAVSLALADDYRLPRLEGKPENWPDNAFPKFPLKVLAWVNYLVLQSYLDCFEVKKNWLMPSLNGLKQTMTSPAPGSLNEIESEPLSLIQN